MVIFEEIFLQGEAAMILEILKIIIWPITFIVSLFIFRAAINSFIQKIAKLKFGNVFAQTAVVKEIIEMKDKIGEMSSLILQIQYGTYLESTAAFAKARSLVDHLLETHPGSDPIHLDIKLTAVGMHYSWPAFLSNISRWVQKYQNCYFRLSILLVDPQYLKTLSFSRLPIDWAKESENRVTDLQNMIDALDSSKKERISFVFRVFQGLPQYHGLVINDEYLFLGRSDWTFNKDRPPELSVGQNRYRYFYKSKTDGDDRGSERVNLFLNWHKFYYDHNSRIVLECREGELHHPESFAG